MAADPVFHAKVMDQLAPLGAITSRAMFGGYGIFAEGVMFALISGSGLFFKVDDTSRTVYEEAGSSQYGAMPYYRVPADLLDNKEKLHDWACTAIALAKAAPKKKRR